jgi:vanillin dehydrogenase
MRVDFIIDGASVAAASGATFERHDPVTGVVASEAAAAGEADVAKVVEAAARAFSAWSQTSPSERRALLMKAADILETRTDHFAKAMTEEIGATGPWAGFNVHFAASLLREAAALTTQITGEIIPADKPNVLPLAVRQPAGVVLGMAPWNAPVILGVRAIAAPLACGNTVILRSSEVCPATHYLIVDTMNQAGFPKGVVNLISNAPSDAAKVVGSLIAHPAVKRVNFTGSSKVGKTIAKLCAEHLKPVLLELGGKAPVLVLADADLDAAVDATIFGAFANQGQICMSTERLVVDESVADAFVAKLAKRASALPSGDPRGHVVLGSLVNLSAAERMDELIADAKAKGAVVVAGGKRNGAIVEATIIDRVTPKMRIYHEESFGPVKPVVRVTLIRPRSRAATFSMSEKGSAAKGAKGGLSDGDDDLAEVTGRLQMRVGLARFLEREDPVDDGPQLRLLQRRVHCGEHLKRSDEDALQPRRARHEEPRIDLGRPGHHADQGDRAADAG